MIRISVFCLLFTLVGCDTKPKIDYSILNLSKVTGTITLDGQPLAGATVLFEDTETSRVSYGVTDSSGNYKLQFDSQQSGVMSGKKKVRISMKPFGEGAEDSEEDSEGESTAPKVSKIPVMYNQETTLSETIERGQSYTFDYALTSSPDDPAKE